MSKTVTTSVTLVSANHISEEDEDKLLEKFDADSLDEVAESMESTVESLLATRVFGDADAIPILDVTTDVHDDWDEDDVEDVRVTE